MPKRYRKLPMEIEAEQLNGTKNLLSLAKWCGGQARTSGVINIPTLEGVMTARPDDYIIKGVKGEFYPCDPDIFHETYEEVEGHDLRQEIPE